MRHSQALKPRYASLNLLRDWDRRLREKPQRNLPVFNAARDALKNRVNVCALKPDLFLSAKRSFRNPKWAPHKDHRAVRSLLRFFNLKVFS